MENVKQLSGDKRRIMKEAVTKSKDDNKDWLFRKETEAEQC